MIELKNLYKSFPSKTGQVNAVAGVSFTANDGEITGLLGPNGAGKTTALRMLYTLLEPDQGHILVDGFSSSSERTKVLQRLGVLPDARGIYKRLTARENIAYFGRLHNMSEKDIERSTKELSQTLGMDEFIDRQCEGFSQGQRTKVAIARALVHGPQNVVLDEPTNGLDVMTTRNLRDFLLSLKSRGKCIIFSSHIMQEVAALCDRIVVIAHGQVMGNGTPDEIRQQTGEENLEDAFVKIIGSEEGLQK